MYSFSISTNPKPTPGKYVQTNYNSVGVYISKQGRGWSIRDIVLHRSSIALSSSSGQFEDLFEGFSRGLLKRAGRHSLPQPLRHRRCLVVHVVRGIHPRDHLREIQISQADRRTTLIPFATPATCLSLATSAGSDPRQRGHPPLRRHHVGDVRALLAHPASAGGGPRRPLDLGQGGRGGGGRSRRRGGACRSTLPKMTKRRGGHSKFRDPAMHQDASQRDEADSLSSKGN